MLAFNFILAKAQVVGENEADDMDVNTYIIFADEARAEAAEVDSLFFLRALPIVFTVAKTNINANNRELQHFIRYAVPILERQHFKNPYIRIRSAASPEGPLSFNKQLSRGRRDALLEVFKKYGVTSSQIQIDVIDEEYELLAFNMRQANDPDAALVGSLIEEYGDNIVALKARMMRYNNGKLWNRIKRQYYPALRASRFIIVFPNENITITPLKSHPGDYASRIVFPDHFEPNMPAPEMPRREILSLKTNLLQDVAYVPQYGFAPLWNIQLEYYPLRGHWTYGASLDIPWWQNRQKEHKYMQIRNWQLETRRYLNTESGQFRGWYAQAYANVGLYGIGFNDHKGWQGEGIGGGVGFGYVWRLGKERKTYRLPNGHFWTDQHHWRLEAGIQLGYFWTKYDPYVWGCPVEKIEDGLYYYDYTGDADLFKERQYRFTWLGPTRIGITLTYDILYRKNHRKGVSFRSTEKGDGR